MCDLVGSFGSGTLMRLQSLSEGSTRGQSTSGITLVAVSSPQVLTAMWTASHPTQPMATTNLQSVCMDLPLLDVSH